MPDILVNGNSRIQCTEEMQSISRQHHRDSTICIYTFKWSENEKPLDILIFMCNKMSLQVSLTTVIISRDSTTVHLCSFLCLIYFIFKPVIIIIATTTVKYGQSKAHAEKEGTHPCKTLYCFGNIKKCIPQKLTSESE